MADEIRMDSHKLLFHPQRVAQWMEGKIIYPIEMEVGLSGACNHRCIFCAVDYMEYTPRMINADIYLKNLPQMAEKGLKSIIYAGEGEPLMHPEATEIISRTKEYGIDVAMSTNGALFTRNKAKECLNALSWVRVSIAAATESTYEKIHRCHKGELGRVLANLEDLVAVKREKKLNVTLGAQLLLLPENKDEVIMLAKIIRKLGFDYFTVKPFSKHPSSKVKIDVDYAEADEIGKELKFYETDSFRIYFRSRSIENLNMEKPYTECEGINFMTYMDAGGDIFPCIVFMGQNEFVYGNINKQEFVDIWESERAINIRKKFNKNFIHKYCRRTCRLDEINKYLYEIKFPSKHVNFI